MEYVNQEVLQEEGRNLFKMGLDPFQDVCHRVSYKAPLKPPSLRRGREESSGTTDFSFEGIPRGFDVPGVGEAAMTDQ